jgi:hypothetical protein
MRWLSLVGLLAVAACAANEQATSVWQKPDGTPVGQREMQSAMLACGAVMADRVYAQQTPYPFGSEAWVQQNAQIQASPAYGMMSTAEINVCLHSFGYNRVALAVGSGSSVPPASEAIDASPPRVVQPPGPLARPPGTD